MSMRDLENWSRSLAGAVEVLGTPEFPTQLERALANLVPFDICMVFAYRGRQRPVALYDNMTADLARIVVDRYLEGPYLLDPFFRAIGQGWRSGLGELKRIAPDRFTQSEYFRRHYELTGIRDEVGFFLGLPHGAAAVLSLARQAGARRFAAHEVGRLRQVEPVVRALAERHWGLVSTRLVEGLRDPPVRQQDPVEAAFEGLGVGLLTRREAEIVALILRGHSNDSIAKLLGIGGGTVKTHRKNIYGKLGISSQAELFSLFIDALRRSLALEAVA